MKMNIVHQIKEGRRIVYDDGRPGHQSMEATVVAVQRDGMTVQFDDRADTNYIRFADRAWMDFKLIGIWFLAHDMYLTLRG